MTKPTTVPYSPEELMKRLDLHLNTSYIALGLFGLFACLLLAVIIYVVYKLIKALLFYRKQVLANQKLNVQSNKTDSDDYSKNSTSQPQSYNDYDVITGNIDKSIADFKSYNERLKRYYKENRPEETPKDLIDKNILDTKYDDY